MWDKMFVIAALRLKITDNEVPSSTNNDATASAFGYNNPLLDLGPACCQNIGTLREALRLVVTQNPGTGTEHWSEPGVARLLHFFSANSWQLTSPISIGNRWRGALTFPNLAFVVPNN